MQKAFYKYNLDIGIGNVAVEIHVSTSNPLNKRYSLERIMDITKRGLNVIYVWINPRNKIVSNSAYNDVISFIKRFYRNPSLTGHYRVIRGSGEFYAAGTFYSD